MVVRSAPVALVTLRRLLGGVRRLEDGAVAVAVCGVLVGGALAQAAKLVSSLLEEMINFFGLAMQLGLTTRQLKSMTTAYPTVASDLTSML